MKMKKLSLIKAVFITTVLFAANALAFETPKDEDVHSYLNLSGANKALSAIPAQIAMMGQQANLTNNNPEQNRKATEAILSAWDEQEVNQAVFDHVKNNISAEQLGQLLAWLKTDFTHRIKQAEGQSTEPQFQAEFMRYMAEIQTAPPSEARIAQINEFVDVAQSVDYTADLVVDIVKAIAASEGSKSEEEVTTMAEQMKSMMVPQLDQQLKMVSFYVYRDINDQDLAKYIDFYREELGQKEISLMYAAIGKGVARWSSRLGAAIKAEKLATSEE